MAFLRALSVAAVFAVALYFLLPSTSGPHAAEPSPGYAGKGIEIPPLGLGTWLSEYSKVNIGSWVMYFQASADLFDAGCSCSRVCTDYRIRSHRFCFGLPYVTKIVKIRWT
jgi:hypothetical protein